MYEEENTCVENRMSQLLSDVTQLKKQNKKSKTVKLTNVIEFVVDPSAMW